MFIANVIYKKPLDEVDRFLQAHRDFLSRHYDEGHIIASGPQTPRVGGVIMLRAADRDAALGILAEDPFNTNHIADYELIEVTLTRFADQRLAELLVD